MVSRLARRSPTHILCDGYPDAMTIVRRRQRPLMRRRRYLCAVVGASALLAGCSGEGDGDSYGDWFSNVSNYDGEVDRTGTDPVRIEVGADDGFAFAPAAIRIDAGTSVVWEWTGMGGRHNVVARDDSFESQFHEEAGTTFEYTFDDAGLFPYYCDPHRAMGMKGGVRVE